MAAAAVAAAAAVSVSPVVVSAAVVAATVDAAAVDNYPLQITTLSFTLVEMFKCVIIVIQIFHENTT